jgi:hypothetical protein
VNRLRAACRHVLDAWCRLPATFPEVNSPKPGDEIVAFLIYNRDEQVYSFTAASWSVFRVVDERIASMTAECAPDRKDLPIDARALLDNLQQPIGQRR